MLLQNFNINVGIAVNLLRKKISMNLKSRDTNLHLDTKMSNIWPSLARNFHTIELESHRPTSTIELCHFWPNLISCIDYITILTINSSETT